jgi:hypothetical protein
MALQAHVLVVASATATSEELLGALRARAERSPTRFTLVLPSSAIGLAARDADRPQLERAMQMWRDAGIQCDGMIGDHNPMDAVVETWDPARFDEAIVSTLHHASSKWLRYDLPHRVAAYTGAHVTHVMTPAPRPEPARAAPRREQSPLGPLGVLAWGGPRDQ